MANRSDDSLRAIRDCPDGCKPNAPDRYLVGQRTVTPARRSASSGHVNAGGTAGGRDGLQAASTARFLYVLEL
jgi:hypothetical protein